MTLTLVILAAGAGLRFGGNKPVAAVGPDGQSLFEYSVYDAFRAGFRHVIFVVGEQQDTTIFADRLRCYGDDLKVEFVVQSLTAFVKKSSVPEYPDPELKAGRSGGATNSRIKPWGTAHAVMVCREHIRNPFVVINADDYYGKENYRKIGHYLLENQQNPGACILPGYRLDNTLTNSGGVNRGVCEVDSDGFLKSITEVKSIRLSATKSLCFDNLKQRPSIRSDSIVSMTFWGFVPAIFNLLETGFQDFLTETPDPDQDEFYLPDVVNRGIESGLLGAKVFETAEKWKGLTYSTDLPEVRKYLGELTQAGSYPGLGVP